MFIETNTFNIIKSFLIDNGFRRHKEIMTPVLNELVRFVNYLQEQDKYDFEIYYDNNIIETFEEYILNIKPDNIVELGEMYIYFKDDLI